MLRLNHRMMEPSGARFVRSSGAPWLNHLSRHAFDLDERRLANLIVRGDAPAGNETGPEQHSGQEPSHRDSTFSNATCRSSATIVTRNR
jgi:hypothetical protein